MARTIRHAARWGGTFSCVLVLVVAFALPGWARMAPEYQDSEPNDGASLATAPPTIRVTFSEPLDDSSTMAVRNECGTRVDNGRVVIEFNEMGVDVTEGHYSGKYVVDYTAVGLGGVTGTTEGSFSFTVAEGHVCGGHDQHKDHDKKKHQDHDKKHQDHDRNGHMDHDDDGHGMGHDDGSGHVGGTHTMHGASSGGHSGHDTSASGHSKHGDEGRGDGEHGEHDGHTRSGSGTFASEPLPPLPADGKAVLVALALCAVMGVIGGAFLRASTH